MRINRLACVELNKVGPARLILLLVSVLLNACQSVPVLQPDAEFDAVSSHQFSLQKGQSIVGGLAQVEVEDRESLAVIGRYFGLGFDEISQANPHLDPWIPESGSLVRLPLQFILPDAPRRGIVLNLAAKRLFYYPKKAPDTVFSYPVGIGREGWETPLGQTHIVSKKAHPSWTVPASVRTEHAQKGDPLPRVVPAGPDNPLGDYAMRLGIAGYLIHGTNKPYGVGMEVSHGCVRLYPEDISRLFEQTPTGTPVKLVNQPYLTAWEGGRLFLQAYPPVHLNKKQTARLVQALMTRLKRIERKSKQAIDWNKVETVLARAEGVPTPILANDVPVVELPRVARPPQIYRDTVPEPLNDDAWRLWVANFDDEDQARRLAAMLNHQGPPIPAHALDLNDTYAVVAGPFKKDREAQTAAKRLRLDFSLEPQLIEPGETYAGKTNASGFFAKFWSLIE